MDDWRFWLLWVAMALNIGSAIYNLRMSCRWFRLMQVIDLLCLDIWRARDWPLRHIIRDDVPPPRIGKRTPTQRGV